MRNALALLVLVLATGAPVTAVTIEALRAEIVQVRKKPAHQRITDLARLHRLARDIAAVGIDPAAANPAECAAAIRTADGFDAKQTGCLGPMVRRELAKGWMTIKTGVHHPCGLNQALDIYQRQPNGRWAKRLGSEESGRGNVITPWVVDDVAWIRMASGIEYVGFTRSRLWCTSTWHPVIFELHALHDEKSEPVITLERMSRITGADPPIRMKLTEGEAAAEFQAIGPGSFDRIVIARYRIDGLRAERISPIALAPHNFVDEWREMPEAEALRFVEGERGARLSAWRTNSAMSFTRACRITPQLWRAESLNDVEPVQVIDRGNFDYRLQLIPPGESQPCEDGWIAESPTLDKVSLIDPKLPKPKQPVLGR